MTCDNFYMNVQTEIVSIDCKEGDMQIFADIPIDDFAFALFKTNDNLDYIADALRKELMERAKNAWDLSEISDGQLMDFKDVLEMIL